MRYASPKNLPHIYKEIEARMKEAADRLDFETAALLRDQLIEIREMSAQKKIRKAGAPV